MNFEISRSDAVSLWSACGHRADEYRKEAKRRSNGGEHRAEYRELCREKARELEALQERVRLLLKGSFE